jgi:uncharacterized protein (TIGR03437 family)
MPINRIPVLAAFLAAALLPEAGLAQINYDTTGNSLLQGNYFIRYVGNANLTSLRQIGEAVSLTGTISFDGNGSYTFNGQVSDTTVSSGAPQPLSVTGVYAVSASGTFAMENPWSTGDTIFGGVGKSAILGSSYESAFFDFMVAVPMASSVSNASLSGTYRMVGMEYPNGDVTKVLNSTFLINPDGGGNLGSITVSGHAVAVSDTIFTQSIAGATYSLSGATGSMTFPAPSGTPLIAGSKQFFVSADGNILVAGSLNGYDMEVGIAVSGTSASTKFSGTYFAAGEDHESGSLANLGYYYLDAFFGSTNAVQSGANTTVLSDQRINSDENYIEADGNYAYDYFAYDYTFGDEFVLGSDGSATETLDQFFVGAGGTARLLTGQSTAYSIELDVQAQSVPEAGPVFLSPLGVVNTANYLPITNPVAGGEFLTLFGTGLSNSTAGASLPFPGSLNGVSVSINERAAPVYFVSPTQIICLVPYATSEPLAVIQVTNKGVTSNAVTLFTDSSAPGVLTANESGTGGAAALHLNYTLVTASNPATVGETIQLFGTGLGAVTPAVADGVGASVSTLSTTNDTIDIFVDGQQAVVSFSGLAPTFAGLYQVNFVVPSIPDSGPVSLDITDGFNGAYNSMALLYVSGGTTSHDAPEAASRFRPKAVRPNGGTQGVHVARRRKRAAAFGAAGPRVPETLGRNR